MNDYLTVRINQRHLYSLRPENVIIKGVIVFLVALIIAPVNIKGGWSWPHLSYIIINLIAFYVGCKFIRVTAPDSDEYTEFEVDADRLELIYKWSFRLACVAIVFKLVDTFFIRGVSWYASTLENQDLLSEGGGNLFSIVCAMLIFTTYIPVTIDMLCRDWHSCKIKIISGVIFFFNILDCVSTGSRFALIRPLVYFGLLYYVTGELPKRNRIKIIMASAAGILVLLFFVGSMFIRRLNDMNLNEYNSIKAEYHGYASTVPATDSFVNLMKDSQHEWYYPILFSYAHVTQYIIHAVFEYPAVMDYVDKKGDFLYGQSTFMVYTKFFQKFLGGENIQKKINEHNLRPGIWSTFFFSWYLDFGWLGPFLFLFVGWFSKKLWYEAYSEDNILFIPILLFLSIIWLLVLQLNYIQGSGTYAITTFLVLAYVCSLDKYSETD